MSGFAGNGAIIGALAVITSGLLFGRRVMLAVLLATLVVPVAAAIAMLTGATSLPPAELVSPLRIAPWVRTTFVATMIWTLLGVAVTFVVSSIERAIDAAADAILDLRAEQARREQAEAERLDAERTALQAQKLELVGSMAAGVAHDFNNVLSVVQGWASLALRPDAPDRARADAAEAMDAAIRQGAALARHLLSLGRRTVRTVTPVRLAEVVDSSVKALRRVLPEDVELKAIREGEAWIDADETEIQQILFNLVINARDAMPDGGRLLVTTGVEWWECARPVVGGQLAPGRWAFVAVRDTGTGIPPEIQARIFEPFFTTKPVGSGTGLGLWTVLGIAKTGGGGLALETEPGAGTCFRLYFPARAAAASIAADMPSVRRGAVRPARILVLEDHEPVRQLIQEVLTSRQHEVLSVSHGLEALEVLRSVPAPFDLLCTDAVVPHTPVREVIEAFERAHPDAPVLIVSGYIEEELTRRGIEQGRYRLLRKPFTLDELVTTVDELLRRRSEAAAS